MRICKYAKDLSGRRDLSDREKMVLVLTACGLSAKEIALSLGISPRTVDTHFSNILEKLSATNKTHAVLISLRQGAITLEEIERYEKAMGL